MITTLVIRIVRKLVVSPKIIYILLNMLQGYGAELQLLLNVAPRIHQPEFRLPLAFQNVVYLGEQYVPQHHDTLATLLPTIAAR